MLSQNLGSVQLSLEYGTELKLRERGESRKRIWKMELNRRRKGKNNKARKSYSSSYPAVIINGSGGCREREEIATAEARISMWIFQNFSFLFCLTSALQ